MARKKRRYRGAAILPKAESTGRILITFRSGKVSRPHTWSPITETAKRGESYVDTALRGLVEETGYNGPISIKHLRGARSNVFVGTVTDEFPPILNWENADARWVKPSVAMRLVKNR